MSSSPRHVGHVDMRSTKHIKKLYERITADSEQSRHESWALVEIDGERRVLFEAHANPRPDDSVPLARRLMTLREALREPPSVARKIWVKLGD